MRAGATGIAQILFLIALGAAVRGARRFAVSVLCFLAGEAAGCLLAPHLPGPLSPRFIEAASALTVAYVAAESLIIPNAGGRWIMAGLCGCIHGLSFSVVAGGGSYPAVPFLAGVFVVQGVVAVMLSLAARTRFSGALGRIQADRALASILAIVGLGWFLLRLKS